MGFYCHGCASLFDENQKLRESCRSLMQALQTFHKPAGECVFCYIPFVKTRVTQKYCTTCKIEAQRKYARDWWQKNHPRKKP